MIWSTKAWLCWPYRFQNMFGQQRTWRERLNVSQSLRMNNSWQDNCRNFITEPIHLISSFFFKDFIISEQFKVHNKIKRKVQRFPKSPLLPHMQILPLINNIQEYVAYICVCIYIYIHMYIWTMYICTLRASSGEISHTKTNTLMLSLICIM